MRIVFIGPFGLAPKSSMSVRALPLARALAAAGHQVLIVMPPWHTCEPARRWQEAGVELAYTQISRIPLLGYLLNTLRLVRAAFSFHPDTIHCFKPKAYAGLAAWIIWHLKRLGLTVARLAVDEDDWEGDGGWNEVEPYSPLLKRFFAWQERWGLRHCDALTVASRALQTIAWSHGIVPEHVYYLPNGASALPSPTSDLRSQLGVGQAPLLLLYTRFVEFGLARLEAIWREVLRLVPDARLLIVGRALDEATQKQMETLLAGEWGTSVIYAGWVPYDELADYIASADAVLFPTDDTLVNRCKCSVKLTDLLTAGAAVAADAVGQNAAYIEQRHSGLLVPAGDNTALARAAAELLLNRELARTLGQQARERMTSGFNWAQLAEIALQAYTSSDSP